jgi:hypothetical protein
MRKIIPLLFAVLLCISLTMPLQGGESDSFLRTLLRVTGISANPSEMKGPSDADTGDIWVIDLAQLAQSQVTQGGGYRSPVFLPGGVDILALKGNDIVRIRVRGGKEVKLYTIEGIIKLVGFNTENDDQVLMLREKEDGMPSVGFVSLKSGQVINLPYDGQSISDRSILDHITGWERIYGDTTVYVDSTTTTDRMGRYREWTNVYIKSKGKDENLSKCQQINCGQPSLSPDRRKVVFIKSER